MAVTTECLESKLKAGLQHYTFIQATDLSDGCGSKFEVVVVSSDFVGKSLLAQHRLVNKIIESERPNIHALTLKTIVPDKWDGTEGRMA